MANDTYTAEQRQKATETAQEKAKKAKLARWKRNLAILAQNAELKRKMQGGNQ